MPEDMTELGTWKVGAGSFLAAVLDCVVQPIWVIDHEGLLRFANPAALAVLGYDDLAELEGRPAHAAVHYKHPDGRPYPVEDCPLTRSRLAGETIEVTEDHWVRRDGSFVLVSYSSAPIASRGGWGAAVAFTDVDERRRLEQALHERDIARVRAAELGAARRRLIEATDRARRRVTRDLHDGAQQRFVNAVINIQLGRDALDDDPRRARALLDVALGEAQAGLDELRELAAGIHPTVLATRGLQAAVEALADRLPLVVDLECDLPGRLAESVEASAYFFVSEALTNAIKHSGAPSVRVLLAARDGRLTIEVADDGVGGVPASGTQGTGLAGLADRIAALGGAFIVSSPPGRGTTIHAEVPLDGAIPAVNETDVAPDAVRVIRRGDQALSRVDGVISSVLLARLFSPIWSADLHTVRFAPGTHQVSGAHAAGVRELVLLHGGRLRVGPLAAPVLLEPGDFADYAADVRHVYESLEGDAEATILTMAPGPDGDA